MEGRMKRFVPRYLDTASRLGEILFGLIMVLTVTLTASFAVKEGEAGVRELLLAAIGCNLAWGVIDAVMYLMSSITARSEKARLVTAVQHAPDSDTALALIRENVEPDLQAWLAPAEGEAFSRSILPYVSQAHVIRNKLTRDDFYGAIACLILVFFSCLPAAVPFLLFSEPHRALRVSNLLLLLLLFLVGWKWARHVDLNPLASGSVMVLVGLALVGVAILLGG
jgi:VIT1/CCC1 family predicted Fe2+/Mn2+ transporter